MRILIQDPDSKRYFDGHAWAPTEETAKEFDSVYAAEHYCHEQDIGRAFVVVKFKDAAAQDIKYAVGPANSLLTSKPPTTRLYMPK